MELKEKVGRQPRAIRPENQQAKLRLIQRMSSDILRYGDILSHARSLVDLYAKAADRGSGHHRKDALFLRTVLNNNSSAKEGYSA